MATPAAWPGPSAASAPASALDQRLSVDVQSVDALRRTARQSPQEGLRQAAKQFEVLFMGMVLKSMREATPSEGLFTSQPEKTYTAMLDQQLAQQLSGRGVGLAEALYAQLSKTLSVPGTAVAASGELGSATRPTPVRMSMSMSTPPDPAAFEKLYERTAAQASYSRSQLPESHVESFVARLLPAAQRASQTSGVPAQLIMAQAALESGWGRREIKGEDGQRSFNLFGIKADRSWPGPVVHAATTEYVDGVAQKTRAGFRAYGSYDEAFSDYARFLTRNPRYAPVRQAADAEQAAHGLQRAGYATDPAYGAKLVQIMRRLE